ncbi:MAG: [FeFe] hydrogenase, group A [Propionivibrio sp.]|jgi:ferredoxin hydrogenase gamma subunit|uniref:2Fe-2S iron-sulfur cluster binding domain-containing protein n=1 Tax=Propionivibrio sp. TaxID=2212460 RepID=UPI001B55DBDB|nr:2Fe-2S iron-sulfur cluster binding domain-containing protein [Propionivibrio sp.]MBP7202203.1 [FeFe] hydrogenase, group A [Propionivibrio sp.]
MYANINGREVEFSANETILDVARRNDVHIPTLCELHDIDHAPGTCRVCLVEVHAGAHAGDDPTPRYVTACDTPMVEGSNVMTRTHKVQAMRQLQMEMTMADHRQDCATCPRTGRCELLVAANSVGLKQVRFRYTEGWKDLPPDTGSQPIIYDRSRCIRCARCVAVCRKIQDVDALELSGWGNTAGVRLKGGSVDASPCVTCGQCVMVCPTGALSERDQTQEVLDYLADPDIVTVFQTAPAIRVGFGEEFGLPPGSNVEGQIIAALRKLGADVILDTNFGADVVIMEEGTELLGHLKAKKRPTFTSCCPAWINFAEKHYPEVLPMLSTTRSPQAVMGKVAKTYLARKRGIDPKMMRMISIMPCTAKKGEAAREQLTTNGIPDVDIVLTMREFARLLRREGINLKQLEPSTYDDPLMSEYSGAGAIFGTTGGVMEAAVRTMYYVVNGKELEHVEVAQLRGFENVRSAHVNLGGEFGEIKVAMCHGLKGTRKLVEAVLDGSADFDFIEIMACPGGCVDGGGTLRSKKAYIPYAMKRRETIFDIDRTKVRVRQSHNNRQVQKLYADYLEKPHSEKAHHMLHTHYTSRPCGVEANVQAEWDEIDAQGKR